MKVEFRGARVAAIVFLIAAGIPAARAQIVVTHSVMAGGGAATSGSEVMILSTVGQPVAGVGGGVRSGFWGAAGSLFIPTATVDEPGALPSEVAIADVYPNPFRESATIRYALPNAGYVHVSVYDVMGREVAVLANGPANPGMHALEYRPASLSSGTYLIRLRTGGRVVTRAVTRLR